MKRKIISAFLALILCLNLAIPAFADGKAFDFVVDDIGYLADGEVSELNDLATQIWQERGIGIFYIYTYAEDLETFDVDPYVGDIVDYYVILENETSWYSVLSGMGTMLDYDTEIALREVYDLAETYVGGVMDFLYATAEYFPLMETAVPETETPAETEAPILIAPAPAETEAPMVIAPAPAGEFLVFDEADLLTDGEETALSSKLEDISHACNAQIVIATIASMDGGDVDTYVDYVYDTMGFGYGENRDGVLLLVCMNPREYRILSNGYAGVAIDPGIISNIGEAIVSDLSDGDYADAFHTFADECEYYLNGYVNGFPFDFSGKLTMALAIGLIAGLITAFVLKGQLKSVYQQDKANVYIKNDSMQLTSHSDLFLYRNVTRTKKQSSSSSSSSGSSRSKGGGSF